MSHTNAYNPNRRRFLGTTASAAAAVALSVTSSPAESAEDAKDGVYLFQGDSITDAGRNRNAKGPNDRAGLGNGYPLLITARLLADLPTHNIQCYNRGISGNKVPDLQRRWQEDCLELKPMLLSILIGVNDIWHKLNGNYDGTVTQYQEGLQALVEETRRALPDTRIVLCEPFVLRCGAVNERWFPEFDQRRAACHEVARQTKAVWVPFQSMFDEAAKSAEPSYWARDGVHPTLAGHALMAKTWLETVL